MDRKKLPGRPLRERGRPLNFEPGGFCTAEARPPSPVTAWQGADPRSSEGISHKEHKDHNEGGARPVSAPHAPIGSLCSFCALWLILASVRHPQFQEPDSSRAKAPRREGGARSPGGLADFEPRRHGADPGSSEGISYKKRKEHKDRRPSSFCHQRSSLHSGAVGGADSSLVTRTAPCSSGPMPSVNRRHRPRQASPVSRPNTVSLAATMSAQRIGYIHVEE